MPPRASWKGHLRLSLVNIPICLYNAISSSTRVSMNQLHRGCNRRLKQQMICPEHGAVERTDIVKGYEYEKDRYVIVEESDLDAIKLETNKTIELVQFIDEDELNPLYADAPYYVAPDGPMAGEAFNVIREAMGRSGKVALGRVVMSSREHAVALRVQDRGLLMTTLRSAEEVRTSEAYFEGICQSDVAKDQLALAEQLIQSKAGPLDLSQFRDRYHDALLNLIKSKIEGAAPVVAQEEQVGQVINLMDALRQSVAEATIKKPPAASVKPTRERKTKRA